MKQQEFKKGEKVSLTRFGNEEIFKVVSQTPLKVFTCIEADGKYSVVMTSRLAKILKDAAPKSGT